MTIGRRDISELDEVLGITRFASEFTEIRRRYSIVGSLDSFFHVDGDLQHRGLLNPAVGADGALRFEGDADNRRGYGEPYALVVTGDLTVDGNVVISAQNDSECALIVAGNLRCTNFCNADECVTVVLGDCTVDEVLATNHQDNAMVVVGSLQAKVVLSGAGDGWVTMLDCGGEVKTLKLGALYNAIEAIDVAAGEKAFITAEKFGDAFAVLSDDVIDGDGGVSKDRVRARILGRKPLLRAL